MNPLLISLLLCLIACPPTLTYAADWQFITQEQDVSYYFDTDSIVDNGMYIKFWVKAQPQETKTLFSLSCQDRKIGDGDFPFVDIAPESLEETVLTKVCNYQASKAEQAPNQPMGQSKGSARPVGRLTAAGRAADASLMRLMEATAQPKAGADDSSYDNSVEQSESSASRLVESAKNLVESQKALYKATAQPKAGAADSVSSFLANAANAATFGAFPVAPAQQLNPMAAPLGKAFGWLLLPAALLFIVRKVYKVLSKPL